METEKEIRAGQTPLRALDDLTERMLAEAELFDGLAEAETNEEAAALLTVMSIRLQRIADEAGQAAGRGRTEYAD